MPLQTRQWKLTVTFLDGHMEEETGDIHLREHVLEVRNPKSQMDYGDNPFLVTAYPLINIRKYTIEEYTEPEPAVHHEDTLAMERR